VVGRSCIWPHREHVFLDASLKTATRSENKQCAAVGLAAGVLGHQWRIALLNFTHRKSLLRVHRYLENAPAADKEVARSLPHFPSQPGGAKQPQLSDLPNHPQSTSKRGE
jgi:hypothetical protein